MKVSYRGSYKHIWSFVYFHRKAEDINDAHREANNVEWDAPDLVSSDTPLESVSDGMHRVTHDDGTEMFLYIWTSSAIWNGRERKAICHRPGLIVSCEDDPDAHDYAAKKMKEKSSGI